MAYDPGALEAALAAAVGEDAALIDELRAVFLSTATAHVAALKIVATDGEWAVRIQRLISLAASFGALRVMHAARSAASNRGDQRGLKRIQQSIDALREATG